MDSSDLVAVVFYDLITRDGRKAIEIRLGLRDGDSSVITSPRKTVYSVAYDSLAGRVLAFRRAGNFCTENGYSVNAVYSNADGARSALL